MARAKDLSVFVRGCVVVIVIIMSVQDVIRLSQQAQSIHNYTERDIIIWEASGLSVPSEKA